MGKNKKKEQKQDSIYRAVKPFIEDNRIIYALLGAVGVGVALAAALGPDKAGNLLEKVTSVMKSLGEANTLEAAPSDEAKQVKAGKKKKSAKENSTQAVDPDKAETAG